MSRNYLHVLKNLPGILARINSELEGKASKASVDALRYTVGRKADTNFVVNLSEIINERFSERPTHADIVLVKEELGVRIDRVEREIETLALNAVKTGQATDITHLVQKVRAPRKPKGPK